jgi:hypothetical protein
VAGFQLASFFRVGVLALTLRAGRRLAFQKAQISTLNGGLGHECFRGCAEAGRLDERPIAFPICNSRTIPDAVPNTLSTALVGYEC